MFKGKRKGGRGREGRGGLPKTQQHKNTSRPRKCTHCGQLILRKISKIGTTRYQILMLKCTKCDFRCGSASDPAGELTALSQTLAVFKGTYF